MASKPSRHRDGQTAAALAEALIKGISQERVRRLFALLHDASKAIADLPRDWTRVLPQDAPLTTVERWEQAFAQAEADDWPDGVDRSNIVLGVIRLLDKGSEAAVQAGEELLPPKSLGLWRRALADGPAQALPVTLTQLRVADGLEPASHVIWTFGDLARLVAAPLCPPARVEHRPLAASDFGRPADPGPYHSDRRARPAADRRRRQARLRDDRRQRPLRHDLFQPARRRGTPSRPLASHRRSVRDLS